MAKKETGVTRVPCADPSGACPCFAVPGEVLCVAHLMSPAKRSKYRAKRMQVDGYWFDSKREARHYLQLKLLVAAGEIADLEVHPEFVLTVNGTVLGKYIGDFRYRVVATGASETIDVKGVKTAVYRWKKKHVAAEHGVTIQEIK